MTHVLQLIKANSSATQSQSLRASVGSVETAFVRQIGHPDFKTPLAFCAKDHCMGTKGCEDDSCYILCFEH